MVGMAGKSMGVDDLDILIQVKETQEGGCYCWYQYVHIQDWACKIEQMWDLNRRPQEEGGA